MLSIRLVLAAFSLLTPALLIAQGAPPSPVIIQPPVVRLPVKHAPRPTSAAISAADLMTRLYIFADDSMMGREAGTLGNKMGTDYIAAEAKRFGLIPAGDNGTYFQTIPLKSRSLAAGSRITVGTASLAGGTGRETLVSPASPRSSASAADLSRAGVVARVLLLSQPGTGSAKMLVEETSPRA
ncbi:MAG: hypothetical protein ABI969_15610 [bacterium]